MGNRSTWRWLLPIVCALSPACGGNELTSFVLQLAGIPVRTDRIALKAMLDRSAPSSLSPSELSAAGLSQLAVRLPSDARGHLDVSLTALDGDRCIQGMAATAVDLPAARGTPVPVPFSLQSPRKCDPLLPCADKTLCAQTPLQSTRLWSVWAISSTDAWAVGDASTILHWDGQSWQQQIGTLPLTIDLSSVWASGPADVWVVGGPAGGSAGYVFHFDGTKWLQSGIGATRYLNAIYGIDHRDIWTVGMGNTAGTAPGEFWHWDGATWAPVITGTGTNGDNYGVWASTPNEIFVVGSNGSMQRLNNGTWSKINTGGTNNLYAVSGYVPAGGGPSVVYAAGAGGQVIHYDGLTAKRITAAAAGVTLYSVWASAAAVYAAGTGGTLIRSVALSDSFVPLYSRTTNGLNGMATAPNGIVWVVGLSGFQGYFDTRP